MKISPAFTPQSLLFNFAPWIVYGLLTAAGQGRAAYLGGLGISLGQIVLQYRARRVKMLDGVTLLFFAAGAVSTLVLHSSVFLRDSSVLAWGTFALVAWGSLLAGSPFTAQYARDAVPPEFWDDPGFRRVNVVITAVWGAVFVVNAALAATASSPMAGKMGVPTGHLGPWLQALSYVGVAFGVVFTNHYPPWVRRHQAEGDRPTA